MIKSARFKFPDVPENYSVLSEVTLFTLLSSSLLDRRNRNSMQRFSVTRTGFRDSLGLFLQYERSVPNVLYCRFILLNIDGKWRLGSLTTFAVSRFSGE